MQFLSHYDHPLPPSREEGFLTRTDQPTDHHSLFEMLLNLREGVKIQNREKGLLGKFQLRQNQLFMFLFCLVELNCNKLPYVALCCPMLSYVALCCPKLPYVALSGPTVTLVTLSYPKVGLYCSKAESRVSGWVGWKVIFV